MRELTFKTAALLEELGHKVTEMDKRVPARFKDDFQLYWKFLSFAIVSGGRSMIGPSFDPTKLDNLTLGLEADAARNLYKLPGGDRAVGGDASDHPDCRGPMTRY